MIYRLRILSGCVLVVVILPLLSCVGLVSYDEITPQGYAQRTVVRSEDYRTVYVSGQLPLNANGELVGAGDLQKQTEQVFYNISQQLKASGGNLTHLVRIDCYLTDISNLEAFRRGRDRFIASDRPPTSTLVQVGGLTVEGCMIEVSAVAIVPYVDL